MKKSPISVLRLSPAFTLVEVLVVIAIIGVLAALAFTMAPKIVRRGQAAKSTENMRQIGAALVTHAADNQMRLPAPRPDVTDPSGNPKAGDSHWFQTLAMMVNPTITEVGKMDMKWWKANDHFLHNPLFTENYGDKKFGSNYFWQSWNPGYGFNRQIAYNLGLGSSDWNPGKNGPQTVAIPLGLISEPSRTPIIAPRGDWHFTYDTNEIKEGGLKGFLVDGKMPILFVDGHVENMPLSEYTRRELYKQPIKP